MITRGLAHAIPVKKFQAMGVAAVIDPRLLASRAIRGMTKGRDALRQVLDSQEVVDRADLAMSFEGLNDVVGLQDLLDIEQRFLTKDQLHSKHS